ncbi:fumarylacetoacetate hydrolase family protein [Hoeflea sp. WL0058]|uniref:Fumarylacetoacetate hydrolase family protein n=1 Tax=Flavimaribacter sediminis TaxID=2865987 RepID=A0AAE3CZY6_9HYPH|nr:fumarylacetoacetate hydrolase family protein [Flavimaribacter sediminis]MBW8637865.1 fumarylacetoacetate hydrolase family protein [Flavimaribacter sediminis]
MKLVSFRKDGRQSYGAVVNGNVIDAGMKFADRWSSLKTALADKDGLNQIELALDTDLPAHDMGNVEMLPPVPDASKIFCIGLNYRTHIAETGRDTPTQPMVFSRFSDSLVGSRVPLIKPKVSDQFDFEGELAVVIGQRCRHVRTEDALGYVAGYSCINEGSVRDYQRFTTQYLAGKTFWHSGGFGPWLTTSDEIPDPHALLLTTRLNGQVMQEASTSDLLFSVPELISYISKICPLDPGDVIATGTTGGVGAARKPPVWMKKGDKVEVEISSIGILSNTIEDEILE